VLNGILDPGEDQYNVGDVVTLAGMNARWLPDIAQKPRSADLRRLHHPNSPGTKSPTEP